MIKMNNKEKINLKTTIITAVVVIVFILIATLYPLIFEEFNPEIHNCDKNSSYCSEDGYEMYGVLGQEGKEKCCDVDSCYYPPDIDCKEWHDKSPCTIDPNAEGCVCDEYEVKKYYQGYNESLFQEAQASIQESEDFWESASLIYHSINNSLSNESMKAMIDKIDYLNNRTDGLMSELNNSTKYIDLQTTNCIKSHLPPEPIKIDRENEKCVEFINFYTGEIVYYPDWFISGTIEWGGVNKNSKYNLYIDNDSTDIYDTIGGCLKKEPKTECEKSNEDYIEECNHYRLYTNDTTKFGGEGSWLYTPSLR